MSAYLVLSPFDLEDEPVPHADLVKVQRPSAAQVTEAAAVLGLFAEHSYLAGELRVGAVQ